MINRFPDLHGYKWTRTTLVVFFFFFCQSFVALLTLSLQPHDYPGWILVLITLALADLALRYPPLRARGRISGL